MHKGQIMMLAELERDHGRVSEIFRDQPLGHSVLDAHVSSTRMFLCLDTGDFYTIAIDGQMLHYDWDWLELAER